MVRLFVLVVGVILSVTAWSESVTVSEVVRVYDGDTITVDVAEWPTIVGDDIGVRIRGVDTPELRGKCEEEKAAARSAREFTKAMVMNAETVVLSDIERGKYFRIVADVYADGVSVSGALIESGFGRAYDGGRRSEWCSGGGL
jgi:endonuclease YncB( thermonuclease family)